MGRILKIRQIKELLNAELLCGEDQLDREVYSACSSDMMSDVLAFVKDQALILSYWLAGYLAHMNMKYLSTNTKM